MYELKFIASTICTYFMQYSIEEKKREKEIDFQFQVRLVYGKNICFQCFNELMIFLNIFIFFFQLKFNIVKVYQKSNTKTVPHIIGNWIYFSLDFYNFA
jgi:hypothetical protein